MKIVFILIYLYNFILVFSYKVGKNTLDNKDLKEIPVDELREQ